MRFILILLASATFASAAALNGPITTDGTYTVTTIPGQRYVFSAAGTFGSGTLAIKWNDGTNATAFPNSPAASAESWTFTAPSGQVDLVLSGSTGASITASIKLAAGNVYDADSLQAALAEDPAGARNAMAANANLTPSTEYSGFWHEFVTAPITSSDITILTDSPNYVREIACVWFNSAYRIIGDNVLTTDTGAPNSYESDLQLWTTTTEPEFWKSSSFTKAGFILQASGGVGDADRYGCATPGACVIGSKLWVAYSGRGGANGVAPRSTCLAYSTNGTSFTKTGALTGSVGVLDDDADLLHDPRTGRTFLYGTYWSASPRLPVVWYTDDADLSTATWTKYGDCTDKTSGTYLPYAVWLDSKTGVFWMVAGSSGNNTVFFSKNGLEYTSTTKTVGATLHSFLITDKNGNFAGWGTNDSGGNTVSFYRKVQPYDNNRIIVPLSFSTVSATGSYLFGAPRATARTISNIKFTLPTAITASGTDYWTFEIKGRSSGGATVSLGISGNTQSGVTNYTAVEIPGSFTVAANQCLQAYWTKSGAPASPAFLTLEYTEHP